MVARPAPTPPIRGLEPLSLTAWEGQVAAVVYLQGCNFSCPACPVPHLIPRGSDTGGLMIERVLEAIYRRRRWLDAVVIAGGEPTVHEGLADLLQLVREFGLRVQLNTNGSRPDVLRAVLDAGDIHRISMVVRAPLDPSYSVAAGTKVRLAAVYESVELLLRDPRAHEFRVPWLTHVVETDQIMSIVRMLSGAGRVVLDPPADGTAWVEPLRRAARSAGHLVDSCVIAGRPAEDFGARSGHPGAVS